jgi:quercetin dioxygenase-like cupin family protein
MCPELRGKKMIPVITRIRATSLAAHGPLQRHPGEMYIYILEGRICLHTEFYEPIALGAGESIYMDGNMGHACVADGCEEATALIVTAPAMPASAQSGSATSAGSLSR